MAVPTSYLRIRLVRAPLECPHCSSSSNYQSISVQHSTYCYITTVCCRYDAQDVLIKLQDEHERGANVGLDISTGEAVDPQVAGIYDNYIVKRQIILSAPVIASQLLLVDEVMRAGINMRGK